MAILAAVAPTGLLQWAENGDLCAQLRLATVYENGDGVAANTALAVRYWRVAGAVVARTLETARINTAGPLEPLRLFEVAAATGHVNRHRLALAKPDRKAHDPARARTMLEALVNDGSPAAPFARAEHVMRSRRAPADHAIALNHWYTKRLAPRPALARLARNFSNDDVRLLRSALSDRGCFGQRRSGHPSPSSINAASA